MFPSSHLFQSFCIVNIKFQILDYKMSIIKFRKQILGRYPLLRFRVPAFRTRVQTISYPSSLHVRVYSLRTANNLQSYALAGIVVEPSSNHFALLEAWLLIIQSSQFLNFHIHRYQSCCSLRSSQEFPAIQVSHEHISVPI